MSPFIAAILPVLGKVLEKVIPDRDAPGRDCLRDRNAGRKPRAGYPDCAD
jgi:hypothetical protein